MQEIEGAVTMRLEDRDGNETDYTLIRWGPAGAWGFDELERDVEAFLPDYSGCDVTMDVDDHPRIIYNDVPLSVVDEFSRRGLIVDGYRFGSEAVALMRRNPGARLGAMVACSYDVEAGWYATVRGVRLQESEPSSADLTACRDIAETFLARTGAGHRLAQSVMASWFSGGMASADAYDWRGEAYGDLATAHELPIEKP